MTTRLWITLAVLGLGLSGTPALAAGKGVCNDDAKRLCAGVKKGEGRLATCLAQHAAELTPACRAKITKGKAHARVHAAKAKAPAFGKACQADLAKLCADVAKGDGRREECLKKHEGKLSEGCRAVLEHRKAKRQAFGQACQADLDKHCANIGPGRKRALACLRQFDDQLSPACKHHLGL